MPREFAIVMGAILLVIASVNLLVLLYEWYCDNRLLRTGAETMGRIIDAATFPEIENVSSGRYRLYAEFKVGGATFHASSRYSVGSKDEHLGKDIAIVYDRENPEKARFKDDIGPMRHEFQYVVLLLVGIGLVVYGVFFSNGPAIPP